MSRIKRERIRNISRTAQNDIRYRGPLSYRHLMILGWIAIIFMVVGIWTNLGIAMDPNSPEWMFKVNRLSSRIGRYGLPLLLLSNYCVILDEKKSYRDLLVKNGGLTLVVVAAYLLMCGRYLFGLINLFTRNEDQSARIMSEIFKEGTRTGSLAFNIFIDIFLCTLFMFFLNYLPKKGYFSKHVLAFRALAVFPVAYELASLIIRILSAAGTITPSLYIYPFLTTKAPMSFVMFIMLSLYIKVREQIFLKNGRTHEDYRAFLKTNANSWQFSVYASFILIITCTIDLIILVVFVTQISNATIEYTYTTAIKEDADMVEEYSREYGLPKVSPEDRDAAMDYIERTDDEAILDRLLKQYYAENQLGAPADTQPEGKDSSLAAKEEDQEITSFEELDRAVNKSTFQAVRDVVISDSTTMTAAFGFGRHVEMIILLPFLLLLSYTRVHKDPYIDALIMPAGVLIAVLVSLECLYQGLCMIIPNVLDKISGLFS